MIAMDVYMNVYKSSGVGLGQTLTAFLMDEFHLKWILNSK